MTVCCKKNNLSFNKYYYKMDAEKKTAYTMTRFKFKRLYDYLVAGLHNINKLKQSI
jgi:hypothetical protein